ncbi:MAG: uncharacterized protein JWM04_1938 [Verrucomicrobiales bacterium]|nr:uncharacterized protein [Verrucomicrobiales bacterium]
MSTVVDNHKVLWEKTQSVITATAESRPVAIREFSALAKKLLVEPELHSLVASNLARAVSPFLDYSSAMVLYQLRTRLKKAGFKHPNSCRVALLGSSTTHQIEHVLDLFLFSYGIELECKESEYGTFRQELLNPHSEIYQFAPRFIILATADKDISHFPPLTASRPEMELSLAAEMQSWRSLWESAHKYSNAQVLQDNFLEPTARIFANHEPRLPGSRGSFIQELNRSFSLDAPPFVLVHDVNYLAGIFGRTKWSDPRFVHHAKMPCSPDALVEYAHSLSSILASQCGVLRKCLVLDLDNTLWGGVIGDDGLGGIRLGQGSAEGEAFQSFQSYAASLATRGVLLAVCSKNTDSIAREVFEKHPEMKLKLSDIACFTANWDNKAENLRAIAKSLNIGLNSLVFVDDNPAERAIVRENVPEVMVPEVGDDVASYAEIIDRWKYFQSTGVQAEDLQRTAYYKADELRKQVESTAVNMDDFLASLKMEALVAPIHELNLERSAQLLMRSNQFNLTTKRRTSSELSALAKDSAWFTLTISLRDKFGDNGLISVILACEENLELNIDTWLMSCRVLKRGVELFVLSELIIEAKRRNLHHIAGKYIRTEKNALVVDHYRQLGFEKTGEAEGWTSWRLDIDTLKENPKSYILRNAQHSI